MKRDVIPVTHVSKNNTNKIKTSEEVVEKYQKVRIVWTSELKIPKNILLKTQIEYIALKIIPKDIKNNIIVLFSKIDTITINSPIKFEVPGKAVFAIEKVKKKKVKIGSIVTKPP